MGVAWLRRAVYRVRQFGSALATRGRPLAEVERTEVRAWLPAAAWPLFDAMPHNDQHHSLNVLRALRAAGHDEPALMQAALLHDVAKSTGGVTLFHRVAVVLIKIVRPDWLARLAQAPAPARSDPRYPFWVARQSPATGRRDGRSGRLRSTGRDTDSPAPGNSDVQTGNFGTLNASDRPPAGGPPGGG